MLKRSLVVFAVAIICITTANAAVRGSEATAGTVGQFVTQLAVALGQEGGNAPAASKALERLGVRLQVDPETPLTEGLVARIAADLGIGVLIPSEPDSTVSAARASVMANLLGSSYVEGRPGTSEVEPPTQCLELPNRGQCVDCCKAAVGPIENRQGNLRDAGKECSKFCRTNIPRPPSDSEPQP